MKMNKVHPAICALGVVTLLGVGIYFFSGWSRINCWTWEIDINSGETRYRRYCLWCITEERIVPTWMSEVLDAPQEEHARKWRPVETLSPGRHHSPHYRYHGAIHDLRTAEMGFELYGVPPERKRELAEAMRDSWNQTGNYREAGRLLQAFLEELDN